MIYHIYWGTAGNAGLYLDEIYQTLKAEGVEQEVFVSHYYPFDYGHKTFFRLTELGHCRRLGKLRNPIRYIELLRALFCIYFSIRRNKPQVVNYSLIGVFKPVILFLKLIKKTTKCKLVLTCHDVMPFANQYQGLSKQERMRKEAFQLADYLLVHNNNSANELKNSFGIASEKILCHRFPIMDLKKIYPKDNTTQKKYDFLFLGHLRKEKGVEVLTEAWEQFHQHHPHAKLCIAGNAPFGFDTKKYEGMNIDFVLQFLSDKEYYEYAHSAKCIILPYTRGTNSGVVSTLVTLDVAVITSDLEMFQSNPLLDKRFQFENGNPQSLLDKMEMLYEDGSEKTGGNGIVDTYREGFRKEIMDVYKSISPML